MDLGDSPDSVGDVSGIDAEDLRQYESSLIAERDSRIQQEIRSLHMETVKLEREWNAVHERDRRNLLQHKETESNNTNAHIRDLNSRITELVVQKEDVSTAVNLLRHSVGELNAANHEVKSSIQQYELSISTYTNRIREKQSLTKYRLNEEDASLERACKDMKKNLDKLMLQRSARSRELESELERVQSAHNVELESLEKGVRTEESFLNINI